MKKAHSPYIAALDIGSSKTVCFIAENQHNRLKILGIGYQRSLGIKGGIITNIESVEHTIRNAVSNAEKMAGINISDIVLNITGSQLKSHYLTIETHLSHQQISLRDISKLAEEGNNQLLQPDRTILHTIPFQYTIDGTKGITDPVGMYGRQLETHLHILDDSTTTIYNFANCVARCQLDLQDYALSVYSAGFSCLHEDEKDVGVLLIECGADHTSIGLYKDFYLMSAATIPIGGNHITNDLAIGLATTKEAAERTKTLYGTLITTEQDEHELIDIPHLDNPDNGDQHQASRADIVEIIEARIDEIAEMVAQALDHADYKTITRNIVVTGGGAQLSGFKEYLQHYFNRPVRLGYPQKIEGLPEHMHKRTEMTASLGMLYYADSKKAETARIKRQSSGLRLYLKKCITWFNSDAA